MIENNIEALITEFDGELNSILNYWATHTIDEENGGFLGALDNDNNVIKNAPKGAVLNARILWSFAAGYNFNKDDKYLSLAERSFEYLKNHFIDQEMGGVFWSVDYLGNPLDTKKQIYAISFAIYGLAEYYKASKNEEALAIAKSLFNDIEKHSFDAINGGYLEALTRDWKEIGDLRLSDKDANEKKTMNTHLHILEAYTNLYRCWPDANLKSKIVILLAVFDEHILNQSTKHLVLFFDEKWNTNYNIVSYGHDIEASWLMLEAAEVVGDEKLIHRFEKLAVEIANASTEGIDSTGAMIYEFEVDKNHQILEKHWWVQAEAMVGFLNAYQLSKDESLLNHFLAIWHFTKKHIIDHKKGEWFWGVNEDFSLMQGEDKAGFWKCPYHNSRACMEVVNRLKKLN
ncbi:N-acyl-D-glucosamine 2-epimerase [Pedobacter changchengzhani]|uniref:Cellobiose 2-epimerase n=1 Tax=Pedobacter changchengzhani TaxID=2529274 RepID=A0A4R5MNM6_9SPHI|nr:AGE family epimerase/isomerase [Pedobacter changchengzhani]TDG37278.1 N-acyl-D-glucosamine 2-epimerase [Pedobacter changchengzhani]